jgi:DNA-binding LytR/AlgR family response regulator
MMPEYDGFMVAKRIRKPVIFITLAEEKLKEALALSPIDILTKPFSLDRLNSAVSKAQKIIINKDNEYALFNVLEEHAKMRIYLPDILFVKSYVSNPRNKCIWVKNDKKYTVTNCKFERLLELAPQLIQVNKSELVALEAIQSFKYDLINLKDIMGNGSNKQITLSYAFRKNFLECMPLK